MTRNHLLQERKKFIAHGKKTYDCTDGAFVDNASFLEHLAQQVPMSHPVQAIPKNGEYWTYHPKVEFETKFALAGNLERCLPESTINAISLRLNPNTRYIVDGPIDKKVSTERYFLKDGACKVLGEGTFPERGSLVMKRKNDLDVYNTPRDAPVVLKRKEVLSDITNGSDALVDTVIRLCGLGYTYAGRLYKSVASKQVMDLQDGGIYDIAVSFCSTPRKGDLTDSLYQCEVEYVGFIPGIGEKVLDSDKSIVRGIRDLASVISKSPYTVHYASEAYRVSFKPTQTTKLDLVLDRV